MENDYKDDKFKEFLNKIQQDSWHLELLISGFAIFGLYSSLEFITEAQNRSLIDPNFIYLFIYYVCYIAEIFCKILIVNLVIHVILRGLWIGAIGLRYVSGEIDYEYLNYKKRFTDHLKKKVGSFDKYIGTLENYCSIIFAVTFLSLFYIISLFFITFIPSIISLFIVGNPIGSVFYFLFLLFLLLPCTLVFIDFVTQGYLKKVEWISFLYLPIYKIFTIITLSFLYRPLVYNLLDNKFGKRLFYILLTIYTAAFFISNMQIIRSNYIYDQGDNSSIYYSSPNNYFDSLEKNQFVKRAAINSKMIDRPFLRVFIPFSNMIEANMYELYKDLKPLKDIRGLSIFNSNLIGNKSIKDSLRIKYLKAFEKMYSLKIDSLTVASDFIITEIKCKDCSSNSDNNNQLGFETIISLDTIPEGLHNLIISSTSVFSKYDVFVGNYRKSSKKPFQKTIIEIPFWYFKP